MSKAIYKMSSPFSRSAAVDQLKHYSALVFDIIWFRPGEMGEIVRLLFAPKPAVIIYRQGIVCLLILTVLMISVTLEIEGALLFLCIVKASIKALYRQGFFRVAAADSLTDTLYKMAHSLMGGDSRSKEYAKNIEQAAIAMELGNRDSRLAEIIGGYALEYGASDHQAIAILMDQASKRLT
jgi:hypothetical protein